MIVLSANLAQFSANYLAASLEGGRDARNWSPYQGTRSGDITGSAGSRQSTVSASAVRWSRTATDWINFIDPFYSPGTRRGRTSITFHSFSGTNNGCSTFQVRADLNYGSNLPGVWFDTKSFSPCWSYATEIRITAANAISPYTSYWARVAYKERGSAPTERQMFTFDTYYTYLVGNSNYHGNFCVTAQGSTAQSCD